MIDPATLVTAPVLKEAEKAGTAFLNFIGARRDREAALLLSNGRLVVYSMAAYANECRTAYSPLLAFSDEWGPAKREEAWKGVQHFVVVHEIYPILQRALPPLKTYVLSFTRGPLRWPRSRLEGQARRNAVSALANDGERYLSEVMYAIRSAKGPTGPPSVPTVNRGFIFGEGSARDVIGHADSMLEKVKDPGQPLIDQANAAYAELEDDILRRHPNLLDWRKVALPGLQTRI